MKTINIPAELRPHLGDSYGKLASIASLFNGSTDRNHRSDYLFQFRGVADQVAQRDVSALKYSSLTTDQKVEAVAGHRAAGQKLLALADAVEL